MGLRVSQIGGPNLRNSALLKTATRGHPGHMTGDGSHAAKPDHKILPFPLLKAKPLRNGRSRQIGGGGKSPKFAELTNPLLEPDVIEGA